MKIIFLIYFIVLFLFVTNSYAQIECWEYLSNAQLKSHHVAEFEQYIKLKEDWGKTKYHSEFDSVLKEQLQFALDSTMAFHNIIGTSASLIMPEKGTWNGVYGMSNPKTGDAIRPDMLFAIASCTKPYVATVVLKLAEESLLSLDDSLHSWLPFYKNIDSTITIRQLLNHTSGASDFSNDNWRAYWDSIKTDFSAYWSPEKTLSYVQLPNFEPGTSGKYSNTGYILAGLIIQKATGDTTFTQTLHNKILNPLNLINTLVDVEEPLVAELAHGWYDLDRNGIRDDVYNQPRIAWWSSFWTSGAMMTTAEDLCRFTWHNYRGDLLNQLSMNEMFDFVSIEIFNNIFEDYGLGVYKMKILGEDLFGHSGNLVWYTAFTVYSQKYDFAISVLVNQDPSDFNYPNSGPSLAATEIFRVILNYYQYPYDKVHPFQTKLLTNYIKPNQDLLKFTADVNNPNNHTVQVVAIIENLDSTFTELSTLFDDGLHNDNLAGDNVFGCEFGPVSIEDNFKISVETFDVDSGFQHTLEDAAHFTSIGPLTLDNYIIVSKDTIPNGGEKPAIKTTIKNGSASKSVANIKIVVSSLDSLAEITSGAQLSIGSIEPGSSRQSSSAHYIQLSDKIDSESDIPLLIKIYSGEYHFWTDTLFFHVYPTHRPISVYPGDSDNNGKVEANDILPIGVYFLNEGSGRENTSVSWEEKSVTSWDIPAMSYADANGDGMVDEKDVIAIGVNWGNTHTTSSKNYQISLADSAILNKHRENFQTLYNTLHDNNEATREIKKLLQDVLGIEESTPKAFALYQNYPNPFNPKTTISYQLPEPGVVELTVYNLLGQKVAVLVNENQDAGEYRYEWDATNFSSGLYFYKLNTKNGFMKTRKMIFVK